MLLQNPKQRFEEFYKIYEESFPEIERRTKQGQKAVMSTPYYKVRVKEEDGVILAFVGYWDLPDCQFIEHLATTEACRGKGYGKKLVEECIQETDKPIFLEIEPVRKELSMTGRRAEFYQRLGFYSNSFPYWQLPLKEGDEPTVLWVMSYGAPITETAFEPFKKEIYQLVYKAELRSEGGKTGVVYGNVWMAL